MARTIDSTGTIETVCKMSPVSVGDTIALTFIAEDDADPPFVLKIKSPSGSVIMERVLRELPTGKPQSAPPVSFTAYVEGEYKVEIKQLNGKQAGQAVLRVIKG